MPVYPFPGGWISLVKQGTTSSAAPEPEKMKVTQIRELLVDPYALLFWTCVLITGTYYSGALVSIAVVALFITGLTGLTRKNALDDLVADKSTLMLMSVLLVYLLSGLLSEDLGTWWKKSMINVPYIAVPLGVHAFGKLKAAIVRKVLYVFIGVTVISALILSIDYLLNFDQYNELYLAGQTIPTPVIHVRYSYFLALAICITAGLYLDNMVKSRSETLFLLTTGIFLLVFIHILAVRTGLLALYGGMIVVLVMYAWRRGKWQIAAGGAIAMIMIGALGYLTMPSLANKIGYMTYDLKTFMEHGGSPEYSDNVRLISVKYGLELFLEHPILGVGLGDIRGEMDNKYTEHSPHFPSERRYQPISQYVYWLAAFGLVGTALLLALWLYPLSKWWRGSYLMIAIYTATLFSFAAETTIQLQLGKTVFLFIVCVVLQGLRGGMITEPVITADGTALDDMIK